jgi:Acetyltransferase (GNAT) domain
LFSGLLDLPYSAINVCHLQVSCMGETIRTNGDEFVALPATDELTHRASAQAPSNPFCTPEFFFVMRRRGFTGWLLGMQGNEGLMNACGAFVKSGKLNRRMEIVSLSSPAPGSLFWSGLFKFCSTEGITHLEVQTFGSPALEIPPLAGETGWQDRVELLLSLCDRDIAKGISANHMRNIRKAERAGMAVVRSHSKLSRERHVALMEASLNRRRIRGENVMIKPYREEVEDFLESGAGDLYQAARGEMVYSSLLVLQAPSGAYYQSAGTSPEGMGLGASHFLVYQVASRLKSEGLSVFNLGGAAKDSSLARFKSGFGATSVPLQQVSCYLGAGWRKKVTSFVELARRGRTAFTGLLTGGSSLKSKVLD